MCVNESYCANETEYSTWFEEATMQMIYVNYFFDPNNYTQPIQYYLGDLWFNLRPD
jgi:hypothetical protein